MAYGLDQAMLGNALRHGLAVLRGQGRTTDGDE